ncbi:MAG: 3-hydroxyacyl-CoA dehydrogenase NAD-binding domain-containing protein [Bacteroidota bacterium]
MKDFKIGVAGSGAMGSGIAQVAATYGNAVVLFDVNTEALRKAEESIIGSLVKLASKQKITDDEVASISKRITYATSLNDFSNADLIIEAIVENIDIKQKLFKDLESIVSEKCILASNTSSLSVTSIAGACSKPERVIGIHFFNPAQLMPLVEIIPGLQTIESTTKCAEEIITCWGKITVLAKDTPGFIVNRIARPFYGEALRIFEEQIADIATIDSAMKLKGGFKMGPFELMDMIGNDINYAVTETVWKQMYYDARYRPSLTQKRMTEAGLFGKKSGKGYYEYTDGTSIAHGTPDESKSVYIFNRILCMLINEAADAVYYGIASRDDIDLAMTKGVNYPKGLLKWCDEIGVEVVLKSLNDLYELYAEDRYRPSVLLKKMAKEKTTFYNG